MTFIFSYSLNCVYEIVVYGFIVKDMCAYCRQTDRQTADGLLQSKVSERSFPAVWPLALSGCTSHRQHVSV